jgi:hypothetical protein
MILQDEHRELLARALQQQLCAAYGFFVSRTRYSGWKGQMIVTAGEIAYQLRGHKQPCGWIACCPAHDDRNPSLSLKDTDDGRILVHCHAGCEQRVVIDALKARAMWPEKPQRKPVVVETYNYTDEAGKLLYQICRTEPKDFFQRRPDGYGGWIKRKSQRQVLYRLPEVLEAP